jgi:filamentous hemagglutinin family protein
MIGVLQRSASILALLGAVGLGGQAAAQVRTNIVPDTLAGRATGTVTTSSRGVTTIDGGILAGANLFHSFNMFDLAAGETARWTVGTGSAAGVSNVINRVTGGAASRINGVIDSRALPNAAFYFINPAGIVFGAGAAINVASAARFSTADELRFDSGAFSATAPGGSVLSVAPPRAFGFLGGQRDISAQNVDGRFMVPTGMLSLTGRNIDLDDARFQVAGLDLAAAGAGVAVVPIDDPLSASALSGALTLRSGSNIVSAASAVADGKARITAGNVLLDGAIINSTAVSAARDAGDITLKADKLTIQSAGKLYSTSAAGKKAANIDISANELMLDNGYVQTFGTAKTSGSAGAISINASKITMLDGGGVSTSTFGSGDAGDIVVRAGEILLRGGVEYSGIASNTKEEATGRGGNVDVRATSIEMQKGLIDANTYGAGVGGTLKVEADRIAMSQSAEISAGAFASGDGGSVSVEAKTLTINGADETSATGVVSQVADNATGRGGAITVKAGVLELRHQGSISAGTFGAGGAGNVNVQADRLLVDGDVNEEFVTSISSSTQTGATGNGGNVDVQAGDITLKNSGSIQANANGAGGTASAGAVSVKANTLTILSGAFVGAIAYGQGSGGSVTIDVQRLEIDGVNRNDENLIAAGVFAENADGSGGAITVRAKDIVVSNQGAISSQTYGLGNAGSIAIDTQNLTIQSDAGVTSATGAKSDGSSDGPRGDAGSVTIHAGVVRVDDGFIGSDSLTKESGASGHVAIVAKDFTIANGGIVATDSFGPHAAGAIAIKTQSMHIDGDSGITSTNLANGAAGAISLSADRLMLTNGAQIMTDSTASAAGDITLTFPATGYLVLEGATIPALITTSSGIGAGGRIKISRPSAVVSNGASILALGQQGGARVELGSDFWVAAADRVNRVSVDGTLLLDSQVQDASQGVTMPDAGFFDVSKVLSGRCPAVRARGDTSQLITKSAGPYVSPALPGAPPQFGALAPLSHCY